MICKHIKSYRSKKKEKENKEIKAPPFPCFFFEKCVEFFFSSANYICRNEYIFSFYTKLK